MNIHCLSTFDTTKFSLSVEELRAFLRVSSTEDTGLQGFILEAQTLIEQETKQILFPKQYKVIHDNTRFLLPYGPVTKIDSLIWDGKKCDISAHSTYEPRSASYRIHVPTAYDQKKTCLEVVFWAGYEKEDHIPYSLKRAVLYRAAYLYENRGRVDAQAMRRETDMWTSPYKTPSLRFGSCDDKVA